MNSRSLTPRAAFALVALICALLLGFGFYLQYGRGLEPCPLCLVQRAFFFAVMAVCLIAALHPTRRRGTTVYAALAALFAFGGGAVAGRQVWLQHLPADKVPQCGPDLYFMMENFPLSRTLKTLFSGTGECAVVDWTFLRLSIAEWSLMCFVVLFAFAVWTALRRRNSGSGS